jgi:hypothetical protein
MVHAAIKNNVQHIGSIHNNFIFSCHVIIKADKIKCTFFGIIIQM